MCLAWSRIRHGPHGWEIEIRSRGSPVSILPIKSVSKFWPTMLGGGGRSSYTPARHIVSWLVPQTRYINRPRMPMYLSANDQGVSRPPYHFRVTSCCTDSGKYCTAALLVMRINIKRYRQYCHICFENYLLNWTWRYIPSSMKEHNNIKQRLMEVFG